MSHEERRRPRDLVRTGLGTPAPKLFYDSKLSGIEVELFFFADECLQRKSHASSCDEEMVVNSRNVEGQGLSLCACDDLYQGAEL